MFTKTGYGYILLLTVALAGCVPASGNEADSNNITGKIVHQISGDHIKLEGTIANANAEAICLGRPSIYLKYPDFSRKPQDLFLGPFEKLAYHGPNEGGKYLLVVPAGSQTSFRQEYRILPANTPYDVVLGGSEADQKESEDNERNLRQKGDYTVLMSVNKYECSHEITQAAMLQSSAFMTDIAISPVDKKQRLDVYVDSIKIMLPR